jgi:DNA repair protein RecO
MHQALQGVVISSNNFSDSDKFYRVFTKELGLIDCIGKGVRKISSRRSYHLDACSLVKVNLHKKHDYYYISEASQINGFSSIKNNLHVTSWALYCLEVVAVTLAKESIETKTYNSLVNTLSELNERASKRTVYRFLKTVLQEQGYWGDKFIKDFPELTLIDSNKKVSKTDQEKIDKFLTAQVQNVSEQRINTTLLIHSL